MSDLNETSYYEIALTNRQVVVAFVILLSLVLAVFLCGVWVGRNDEPRLAQVERLGPGGEPVEPAELAHMEEFKFFEKQQAAESAEEAEAEADLDKPDLGRLAEKPRRETTLAQDVGAGRGSAPSPEASPPPPRSAPPESTAPPPPAQTPARTPPAQTTPAPPAADSFVVQVFSSRDEAKALQVQKQVQDISYRAFLSTVDVGGQTMYRVRIGPFTDRDEAERIKIDVRNRLRLETWVTAASN